MTAPVVVKRPDGSAVKVGDPGVTILTPIGGFLAPNGATIVSVNGPATGQWSVVVNGLDTFSLAVTGESTLDLARFQFVQRGGRPGHEGFFPITGMRMRGKSSFCFPMAKIRSAGTRSPMRSTPRR